MLHSGIFRMLLVVGLITAGWWLGGTGPASAAKLHFGTSETLEKIQDTTITGQNNEKLYLGYKYSHHSFIAPYMMTDDGYILGVEGQNRYYKLTPELRDRFQAQGLLPKPLPTYEIAWYNWVLGHLLWLVIGLIAVSWLVGTWRSKKAAAAVPLLQEGFAHHEAGRTDEALASYNKSIAVRPLTDALFLRAHLYREKGEPLKAIADYSQVLKQDAKHAGALFRRAAVFAELKRFDEAIADLNRVQRIDKNNPDVLFARGETQAAKGVVRSAVEDFTAALAASPDRADILSARAAAYERLGDNEKAAADHAAAAQLASTPVDATTGGSLG